MKSQTYLQIPTPCHEDWNKMTPNQQGRHCDSCCRTVVDFQLMTDQQILNYFTKSSGNICGRFTDDQLYRPLEETVVKKKKGWQWFLASVASLSFFVNRGHAQGKVNIAVANQSSMEQQQAKQNEFNRRRLLGKPVMTRSGLSQSNGINCPKPIKGEVDTVFNSHKITQLIGSVTDEKGNPIAGVTVSITTQKGNLMFATNEIGEFFINNPIQLNEEIKLKFSSLGYEEKSVPVTFDESKLELHVQLKSKPTQLDEIMVVAPKAINCRRYSIGGAVSSVRVQQIKTMDTISTIIRKVFKTEGFKIFPNPASRGKAVNFTFNGTGNYSVQLLDNQSRLIKVENISVSNKQEIRLYNIPSTLSSGTYYIRLENDTNKKQYIDKLLVQ